MALWFEITARVPPEDADAVAALMRDVSPGGVTIEQAIDILGPEMGYTVREGDPVMVRAYLPSSELGAVLTDDLRRAMQAFPAVELTARPLYEEDWAVSWREFFGVVDTGRLVIVPSWIEHEIGPGQIRILLDPGQAFGTGHHETTRLCLSALAQRVTLGMDVLDVGTGSGVLSIAAVLLGARGARAVDIDPIAVEVARENCNANGVAEWVELSAGTLTHEWPGRYDLVVSNISTDANLGLAPAFRAVVRENGWLLLSGILAQDAGRVQASLQEQGFEPVRVQAERDWCLIEMRRGRG